jgi:hypothetical protein
MADSKVYDFLRSLDDSDKLAAFENDAEKAMEAAGLSNEEKEVIKSGDEERIMGLLGTQGAEAAFRVIRIRNIRIRFGV